MSLLSQLWLTEPDAETIARATLELALPPAEPGALAAAYASLLLLNVYPYGTAFTDPAGELNGPAAMRQAARYAAHGYRPPALGVVGAPDHLGLCVGFLDFLAERQAEAAWAEAYAALLAWAPALCLAVRREPGGHPFYQALAERTAVTLLEQAAGLDGRALSEPAVTLPLAPAADGAGDEEVRLRDVLRFFLAPARCGLFLSRARLGRLARPLGAALPFGTRFDVAAALFTAAGETGRLPVLLEALTAEVGEWSQAYAAWAETYPAWGPEAAVWQARLAGTLERLAAMEQIRRAG